MTRPTIRRTFITGLVITLPLIITVGIIHFVLVRLEQLVSPLIHQVLGLFGLSSWADGVLVAFVAPILSLALAAGCIYLVGLVGGNVLGRQFIAMIENAVMHVPVVRNIYGATRQVFDTFSHAAGQSFSRVVLVAFPRPGCWTLGLVTGSPSPDIQQATGQALVSVFVPTTPNPTSGYLLFLPEAEIIPVHMSVDDAFKMVISGGVLGGQTTRKKE